MDSGMDGGSRNEDWQAVQSAVSVCGANIGIHLEKRSFSVIAHDLPWRTADSTFETRKWYWPLTLYFTAAQYYHDPFLELL